MNTILPRISLIFCMIFLIILNASTYNNFRFEILTRVYNGLENRNTFEKSTLVFDNIKQRKEKENKNHYLNKQRKEKENKNHYWNDQWGNERLTEETFNWIMGNQYIPTVLEMDFGFGMQHVIPFYGVADFVIFDDFLMKVLCHMTDALMFFPLALKINRAGIKIISATEILAILSRLITKPVLAKIEISPTKRIELYKKLQEERYFYIDNYLSRQCTEETAMNTLKHYVFEESESMKRFVKYLQKHRDTGVVDDERRLRDPELYEKLRYNLYIEVWLSKQEAVKRISDIYTQEELNLINIPLVRLFDNYLAENLFDTVSFEDYYALNVFVFNNYSMTNFDTPIVWRIKKAIYRLAIRQLDSIIESSKKKTLYCVECIDSEYLPSFNLGLVFTTEDFLTCNEEYIRTQKQLCANDTVKIIHMIILSRNYIAINLNNIFTNSNRYIILSGTSWVVSHNSNVWNIPDEVVTMRDIPLLKSKWIVQVANEASKYTKMDNNSYVLNPFKPFYCTNEE